MCVHPIRSSYPGSSIQHQTNLRRLRPPYAPHRVSVKITGRLTDPGAVRRQGNVWCGQELPTFMRRGQTRRTEPGSSVQNVQLNGKWVGGTRRLAWCPAGERQPGGGAVCCNHDARLHQFICVGFAWIVNSSHVEVDRGWHRERKNYMNYMNCCGRGFGFMLRRGTQVSD